MKVAIVEDEERLARALKQGFELEGHAVDYFLNVSSAKEKLEFSNLYDLIVLDLMLPDGDGAEVCTDLRATGVTTPILVLTARDSTEDKIDLLDRGADDFLTKPFELGELIARGRALGRRPTLDIPAELSIGDVIVSPGQRRVMRGEKRVNLTEREFGLLVYLMRNQGRIVTRDELFTKVWKQDGAHRSTNVVDVHVRNLRKKIDEPYATKLIQTVHGVGYTIA